MNVILVMIPISIVLLAGAAAAFFWAVDNDQFDDMETPGLTPLGWVAVLASGMLFGAGLAASTMVSPEAVLAFLRFEDFGLLFVMGAAALVAEGCNINQGLTNSATLALGSLLTFASMCAGATLTTRLLGGGR